MTSLGGNACLRGHYPFTYTPIGVGLLWLSFRGIKKGDSAARSAVRGGRHVLDDRSESEGYIKKRK